MREDQLSPQLGRLIDAAKDALPAPGLSDHAVEAVALLTESGAIFTGCSAGDISSGGCHAAASALTEHGAAGGGDIDAAALALNLPSDSVVPCPECLRELAAVDPELPLLIKQLGRWVFVPISALGEKP